MGDMLNTPTIKHYLSILDLDVHDAEGLFHLLDDGDGQVTLAEFVSGVERMKGQARSADMVALLHQSKQNMEQGKMVLAQIRKLAGLVNHSDGVTPKRQSEP